MTKEGTPAVSVIIPAYNAGSQLRDAIESASRQTYGDREVIVVDDGSTDQTESLVSFYGDRIRYYKQANRGVAAARNLGIAKAKGKYIAFLDADDLWLPTKLAEQVPLLEADPSLGLVYTDWAIVSDQGEITRSFLRDRPAASGDAFEAIVRCGFILTSGTVVRRACLDAVGSFDESRVVAEDYDLWLRVCYRWKIALVDKPLVVKRSRHTGLSSNSRRTAIEKVALFEKALKTYPDLSRKHRHLMRHQLMQSYWDIGYDDFDNGAFGSARHNFLCSLKAEWTSRKAFVYLLASCLPVSIVSAIRKLKKSAGSRGRSPVTPSETPIRRMDMESLLDLLVDESNRTERHMPEDDHSLGAPDRQMQGQP